MGDAIYIIWISIGETKEDVAMLFEDEPSLSMTAYCDKIRENSRGIFEISKNSSMYLVSNVKSYLLDS